MIVCYKRWDQIIFVLRMLINLITKFSTHTSNHTLANLVLPWGDQQWNLYVTYTVNMDEVWATLMGPKYSVGFNQCSVLKQFSICHFLNPNHFQDLLVTLYIDIKAAMLEKKTRPVSIYIGDIYLIFASNCWSRVKIVNKSIDGMLFQCLNIDHGSSDWIPMDEIYVCDSRFLKLPAHIC
jgi:tudor domain-containing protein 1/4/6/7